MSSTLLVVFVGSVAGALALAVYCIALMRETRQRQQVNTYTQATTQPVATPAPTPRPSLPGLPPAPTTTWGSSAGKPLAAPPTRLARGSIAPPPRRTLFVDPEFADEVPTQQTAVRSSLVAVRRVRGQA